MVSTIAVDPRSGAPFPEPPRSELQLLFVRQKLRKIGKIWVQARILAAIDRIVANWRQCLSTYGGSNPFGDLPRVDAIYAPVCARFLTYDVKLDQACSDYCRNKIMSWSCMKEWLEAAQVEPDELEELDVEF